jgi:hypothetical protein
MMPDNNLCEAAVEDRHRKNGARKHGQAGVMEAEQERCHAECAQPEGSRVRGAVHQEQVVPVFFIDRFQEYPLHAGRSPSRDGNGEHRPVQGRVRTIRGSVEKPGRGQRVWCMFEQKLHQYLKICGAG